MKIPSLKLSGVSSWYKNRKQRKISKNKIENKKPEAEEENKESKPEESKTEKKEEQKKSKIPAVRSWYKARKQKKKEKEEEERRLESPMLKLLTLFITAIAMGLGMSFLPLFPQPLPMLLAILIAFATYRLPRLGMAAGGIVIGVGLLYHLAQFYFISFLGDTTARAMFIVVWMALFIGLPLIFNRYRSALAIDFGILAFVVLFFQPTYFLAIPLILVSAVFFKKYVAFTMVYYVLLTVPLQLMQYFQYTVLQIERTEWWLEAGSSPPIIVPLTSIVNDLGASMSQFRLYDTSKVVYSIAGQTTWIPDWTGRTIGDAVTQYLDSVPGLIMFVIIVAGLAMALVLFTRFLIKEGIVGRGDKFLPCFNATIAAALFFILLSALQVPLAFTADISPTTMILGIFATLLLTSPSLFMDFNPNKRATNLEIAHKAQALLEKQVALQTHVDNIVTNTPVNVASPAGKVVLLKSALDETLDKSSKRLYTLGELDQKFEELEHLGKDIDIIYAELNTALSEYQIFASCEYSNWVGKLKSEGLDVKTQLNLDLPRDVPLEQKVETIKNILGAGKSVAKEVAARAEPIYGIIRLLYDPSLPNKSRSVEFALERLATNEAPWAAIDALYNAINNWKRQYGADIKVSMKHLQKSIAPIAVFSGKSDLLLPAFGENTPKVLEWANKAEAMKAAAQSRTEKQELDILDVIHLDEDIQSFLTITNGILSTLQNELRAEEETIERLLPTKDYLWEKNITLAERLEKATAVLDNPSGYKINHIMENMHSDLACIEEGVQTLAQYSERREFLLNYPIAEAAIEEALKRKKHLVAKDLPFEPKFSAEYLRLYYTMRYGEYTFDVDNKVLSKRALA